MSAPNAFLAFFAAAMLVTPVSADPLALVYRGPAGCQGCSEAVAAILETSKYQFRVEYVGPNEPLQLNAETLKHAILYAQPGGGDDVPHAAQSIGAEGLAAVRDFVFNQEKSRREAARVFGLSRETIMKTCRFHQRFQWRDLNAPTSA